VKTSTVEVRRERRGEKGKMRTGKACATTSSTAKGVEKKPGSVARKRGRKNTSRKSSGSNVMDGCGKRGARHHPLFEMVSGSLSDGGGLQSN